MPDYLILPFIIFVVLPIIIGIFYLLNGLAKAAMEERKQREQERRQREAQEEARRLEEETRRRKQEEKERSWQNYYRQQLALARQLRRTDQEIEQWARENYKTILAKETTTIADVDIKLENWAEYFKSQPHGQEIIDWWMEPLKEIKFAKKFVAQGGEYHRRLQERLAQEELQAQVLQFRKEFAERFQQQEPQGRRERSYRHPDSDDSDGNDRRVLNPEVLDPESKKGGFFRGLLAELRKAIHRH